MSSLLHCLLDLYLKQRSLWYASFGSVVTNLYVSHSDLQLGLTFSWVVLRCFLEFREYQWKGTLPDKNTNQKQSLSPCLRRLLRASASQETSTSSSESTKD